MKTKIYESQWFPLFDIWWSNETPKRRIETIAAFVNSHLNDAGKEKLLDLLNK